MTNLSRLSRPALPGSSIRLVRLGVVVALGVVVSACAVTPTQREAAERETAVVERSSKLASIPATYKAPVGPKNVRIINASWLGKAGFKPGNGQPLPSRFEGPDGFVLTSPTRMTLGQVADQITQTSGISVIGVNSLGSTTAANTPNTENNPLTIEGNVNFAGPLSKFLDLVAGTYNVDWEYADGRIRIFDVDTRSFTLVALGGSTRSSIKLDSTIQALDAEDSSSDTAGSRGVTSEQSMDYWSRVEDAMKGLLPQTATYVITPETGTVTVTARKHVLDRVASYIERENAILTQQVAITIDVLAVDVSKADEAGVNLGAIVNNVGSTLSGVVLGSILGPTTTFLDAAASTVAGSITGGFTNLNDDGSVRNGAAGNASLLIQNRAVTLANTASALTLNNRIAPISIATQQAYLSESSTTTTDTSTETELTPGTFTTGFSASVTPRILSAGRVAVSYDVGISNLNSLETIGTDTTFIQTPEISSRSIIQNSIIRSGETMIVAAFNQDSTSSTGDFTLSTGDSAGGFGKTVFVVLMTPVIIDDTADYRISGSFSSTSRY